MRRRVFMFCLAAAALIVVSCSRQGADEADTLTPEMKAWVAAWARRETVTQPEWAGGREVLRWPAAARADLPEVWCRGRGLLDLGRTELEERLGTPARVLANESVSGELLLYDGFGLVLYDGVSHGWVPRSDVFEEYFVQPDI